MPSVRDIREGPPDEYWERLRHLMGPEGLITYWYLGRGFNQHVDPDTMSLRSDMRNGGGGLMALVESLEFLGPVRRATLRLEQARDIVLRVDLSAKDPGIAAGQVVPVGFPTDRMLLFADEAV